MKLREFVCVGEHSPQITPQKHAEFLLQLQKAMLASLQKRGLLNVSQHERCLEQLEKQYSENSRSQA